MSRFAGAIRFVETAYDRFNKWAKGDVFESVFAALSVDVNMQYLGIGSTSVKVASARRWWKKGA